MSNLKCLKKANEGDTEAMRIGENLYNLQDATQDNLGFTYAELDRYIRTGEIDDQKKKERIDYLHKRNLFKLKLMPVFEPDIPSALKL